MPLLSGVMVAGAQEETSCVGADVFRATLREPFFFHSLQTQLGLLVDELTAQLRHKTETLSQPNSQHDNTHLKVSSSALPLWTSTAVCWWLVAAWDTETGPPSLLWRQSTELPSDPSAPPAQSLDHSAAMTREVVCATVCNHTSTFTTVVIVTWLPVPVHGAMLMAPSCRSCPRG